MPRGMSSGRGALRRRGRRAATEDNLDSVSITQPQPRPANCMMSCLREESERFERKGARDGLAAEDQSERREEREEHEEDAEDDKNDSVIAGIVDMC